MKQTVVRGPRRSPATLVCPCFNVNEAEIGDAVDILGATTIEELTELTAAGGGCRGCHGRLRKMLSGVASACADERCSECGFHWAQCTCRSAAGFLDRVFAAQAAS